MINEKMNVPVYNVQAFNDAPSAVEHIKNIYQQSIDHNLNHFKNFVNGENVQGYPPAFYPYIYVVSHRESRDIDSRLSYGFVRGKGTFGTTVTRPDLFSDYYEEQLGWLLNHNTDTIYVGISNHRIPLHFSFFDEAHTLDQHIKKIDQQHAEKIPYYFAVPNIKNLDDAIANGTYETSVDTPLPLSIYNAERVDISLQRLMHYTGTSPDHFQQYILLTNYQFYVDEFISYSLDLMDQESDEYTAFVQPGNHITYNKNLKKGENSQPYSGRA